MADNSAAKLAAGRKMLQEFQKKKTVKQTDIQDIKNKPEVNHLDSMHNYTDENRHIQNPEPELSTIPIGDQMHTKFILAESSSFFDKFSPEQNIESKTSLNDEVPLANVFFSNQNDSHDNQNVNNIMNSENEKSDETFKHINSNGNGNLHFQEANVCLDGNRSELKENIKDIQTVVEISKLQQQLQFHIKTVEFLVTEKNELAGKINEYEKTISDMREQTEDLSGRLNTSRHRASHLEMECLNLKQKYHQAETQISQLLQTTNSHQSIENEYKKQIKELEDEHQELKNLMDDKVSENRLMIKRIEEMTFQLNSNELRLQQIMRGNNQEQDLSIREHCANLEQTLNVLRQQLSQSEIDQSQSNLQYQQYVQQLNNQIESLNDKQEQLLKEKEHFEGREDSLVKQISALEKQLQTMQSQNLANLKLAEKSDDTSIVEKCNSLQDNNATLAAELNQKESQLKSAFDEMNDYKMKVEELSNALNQLKAESPDVAKLNAAMESDRLAAQKATTQNSKMKLDLQHLEKAFEQMTNSKLELAELLQAEKNLTKTLTLKLVETEETYKDTKSKLLAKDDEMIRLQAVSNDLQKEMLKQAQITDRLNHYEAQRQSSDSLQSELQIAKNTIQSLSNENERLKKNINGANLQMDTVDSGDREEINKTEDIPKESDVFIQNIPTVDAMAKLETKFTRLMKEVADLSDDKQKLEHLVLQLQGETETICEYIALYQKQRSILKQRESERNAQLNLLSKERENMRGQLDKLKSLIGQVINKNPNSEDKSNSNEEIKNTEGKIMDLLSEIKGNHLIEPNENCGGLESFHPCPWCSGKLINV